MQISHFVFKCSQSAVHEGLRHGYGVGNTAKKYSVFSLIQKHKLKSARVCG